MRRSLINEPVSARHIGGLWRSCRVEIISLAIALALSALGAFLLPPALGGLDAVGASFVIFLIWGAVCVAIYRLLLRNAP
jgi:hypothetical protein